MAEPDIDLARFGATYQAFMDAVITTAAGQESPLVHRIAEHLPGGGRNPF
jgi:hypothetical protein